MKNTNTCPKCNSSNISKIDEKSAICGSKVTIGMDIFQPIVATRYVCCDCGYLEEWVEDLSSLYRLSKKSQ